MRIPVIIFLFICCFFWQQPVELIEATTQKWVSGVPDGGSTIRYSITMVAKKPSEKIHFKSLNINEIELPVMVYKYHKKNVLSSTFAKRDTIVVMAVQKVVSSGSGIEKPKNEAPVQNIKCKGKVFLQYEFRGRQKHICIAEMKRLKNKYLP